MTAIGICGYTLLEEAGHPAAPTAKSVKGQIKEYFRDYPDQKPKTTGELTSFFNHVIKGQIPSVATGYNGRTSRADPRPAFQAIQNVWEELSPAHQRQVQRDLKRWQIEWWNRSSCLIL